MAVFEADICIIGGGITAALVAEKIAALRPNLSMIVVEAGRDHIGKEIKINVTSVLQTSAGRMIFGKYTSA